MQFYGENLYLLDFNSLQKKKYLHYTTSCQGPPSFLMLLINKKKSKDVSESQIQICLCINKL